jgi:DNA replication protein DnaC
MTDPERRDLLEILEDRYDRSSTIITTQLPTKSWHEALGDPTIADAICDRLVHNAHVLALRGPSMRRQKGMKLRPQRPKPLPDHPTQTVAVLRVVIE